MIANMFNHNGHTVDIYSLNDDIPFYKVNSTVSIYTGVEKNFFKKYTDILKLINKKSYDNVMVISMGKLSLLINFFFYFCRVNVNLVSCDHVSVESFSLLKRRLKLLSYKYASKVIVLTSNDKKYLEAHKIKNVEVIPNASPFESLSEEYDNILIRRKRVLAVGRLTKQKSFTDLIKIWERCNTNNWILTIVGDGEEREDLISLSESLDIKNIEFLTATKDIEKYYLDSQVLAMTSIYEGLPMVLIEAKSFGIPTIAYDCKTGPSEIICNDGYVIKERNIEQFVYMLNNILNDDMLRSKLSERAKFNAERYSHEEIYKLWSKVMINV